MHIGLYEQCNMSKIGIIASRLFQRPFLNGPPVECGKTGVCFHTFDPVELRGCLYGHEVGLLRLARLAGSGPRRQLRADQVTR